MSNILSNKTVIVTGGAGGLGKAIATAALEAGANVVIVDINEPLLEQCYSELSPQGPLLSVKADVTCESSAQDIFTRTTEKFGGVDVLVNNAGIMDTFKPVGEIDMVEFERVMSINVKGPAILSKLAVNAFLAKETPSGNIVNIGSQSSFRGGIAGVAYTASKHALKGITLNTAAMYGSKGIRCNIIMPGGMHTNIADCFKSGVHEEGFATMKKSMHVHAPMVDTKNLGKTVTYLMSDYSDTINGACITADGGWAAF
ncbi:hypothetical protein FQN54_002108 [Arachnomyces sp. PD_36]|nr:hypothetical protein FQN54_002108 [Arachnomyces sp. PD_36]